MTHDVEAARAKAEASFKPTEPRGDAASVGRVEREAAERAVREKTERLREARLAVEALKRKGLETRAQRRRGR